eukprot:scaffold7028_cov243-Pinguiococcus_pyrenoidosus.AAC.7
MELPSNRLDADLDLARQQDAVKTSASLPQANTAAKLEGAVRSDPALAAAEAEATGESQTQLDGPKDRDVKKGKVHKPGFKAFDEGEATQLCLSDNEEKLAVVFGDCVSVFATGALGANTPRALATLPELGSIEGPVTLSFSRDSRKLFAAGGAQARVCELGSSLEAENLQGDVVSGAFLASGQLLLCYQDGDLMVQSADGAQLENVKCFAINGRFAGGERDRRRELAGAKNGYTQPQQRGNESRGARRPLLASWALHMRRVMRSSARRQMIERWLDRSKLSASVSSLDSLPSDGGHSQARAIIACHPPPRRRAPQTLRHRSEQPFPRRSVRPCVQPGASEGGHQHWHTFFARCLSPCSAVDAHASRGRRSGNLQLRLARPVPPQYIERASGRLASGNSGREDGGVGHVVRGDSTPRVRTSNFNQCLRNHLLRLCDGSAGSPACLSRGFCAAESQFRRQFRPFPPAVDAAHRRGLRRGFRTTLPSEQGWLGGRYRAVAEEEQPPAAAREGHGEDTTTPLRPSWRLAGPPESGWRPGHLPGLSQRTAAWVRARQRPGCTKESHVTRFSRRLFAETAAEPLPLRAPRDPHATRTLQEVSDARPRAHETPSGAPPAKCSHLPAVAGANLATRKAGRTTYLSAKRNARLSAMAAQLQQGVQLSLAQDMKAAVADARKAGFFSRLSSGMYNLLPGRVRHTLDRYFIGLKKLFQDLSETFKLWKRMRKTRHWWRGSLILDNSPAVLTWREKTLLRRCGTKDKRNVCSAMHRPIPLFLTEWFLRWSAARRVPMDFLRMFPIICNPIPPPFGLAVPLLACVFPRALLTHQFHTQHEVRTRLLPREKSFRFWSMPVEKLTGLSRV